MILSPTACNGLTLGDLGTTGGVGSGNVWMVMFLRDPSRWVILPYLPEPPPPLMPLSFFSSTAGGSFLIITTTLQHWLSLQ